MASWREIDRLRKDPIGFRALAKALLAYEDHDEWKTEFLESIVRLTRVDEFSTRQGEKLLQIRDDAETVTVIRGFSVKTLIRSVYEARLDLSEADEEWIAALWQSGVESTKRKHAGRLLGCAQRLGLVESAVPA